MVFCAAAVRKEAFGGGSLLRRIMVEVTDNKILSRSTAGLFSHSKPNS